MGSFWAVASVEIQLFSLKKLVLCEQLYIPSSSLSSFTISGGFNEDPGAKFLYIAHFSGSHHYFIPNPQKPGDLITFS